MGSVVLDSVNNTIFTPRHPTSSYTEALNAASSASVRPGHARSTRSSSTAPPQQRPDPTTTADRTSSALTRSHVPQAPTSSDHTAESLMSQRVSSVGSSTSATTGNAASSPASHGQPLSSRPASIIAPRASAASTDAVDGTMNISTRPARPRRIKVRDLQHIQSFATEDMGAFSEIRDRSRSRSRGAQDEGTQYEISEMKVEHIIEMVAGLLTKITSTNDQQHEHLHRQPPTIDHTASMSAQTSSVLAFHGKNIPSITILSYLSRINKYCPTSYEVFLSLLVYFDRMTERVNAGPIQGLRQATGQAQQRQHRDSGSSSSSSSLASDKMEDIINSQNEPQSTQTATPPASGSMEKAVEQTVPGTPHSRPRGLESPSIPPEPRSPDLYNLSHFFVVDSFNIHRLVIAGVTCASKFFSDIFYTNSRYAKVGGLPLPELNHLELQFLLLNDFRLSIPVEEIEAYGTMLVEFYAREVVAQQRASEAMQIRSSSESSADSASTVQAVA